MPIEGLRDVADYILRIRPNFTPGRYALVAAVAASKKDARRS